MPVEAIFKKDETEVVYVKKPEEPKKAAEKGGLLSSVFAAGKKDAPPAKLDPKDAWKEKFDAHGDRDRARRASTRSRSSKGLTAGTEVAVEDPTRPKEKKDNE